MKRKQTDSLFQALTGLVQVVTMILFIHCLQAALGLVAKVLSLFIVFHRPVGLI
jgi:hypothetical protein